ncbi:MAG: class I SAM-dependent methyltransferase [Nitrospinota bacterium]|nr:class I SAM-dependent methyltransferase [Nitrospinota bacterium]MDP7664326.1 class I SAM-dependent methyltransferase [Nitrospinota bacterium]
MLNASTPSTSRTCNICDSQSFELQYKKSGYSILKCLSCGLKFTEPIPDNASLKSIYGQDYFQGLMYRNYQDQIEQRTPDYLKWIRWIVQKSGIQNGNWLDIGCATGGFMKVAEQSGWKVSGVDFSEYCIEIAQQAGLTAVAGTANSIPDNWGEFDIISMWDTIEHLTNPLLDIQTSSARLKPNGWLVLSTGDIGSLVARVLRKHWWLMLPPVHLYFFTKETLTEILKRAGLTPVSFRYFGRRLRIGRAARLLTGNGSVSMERGPSLYFNAFDIVTVLARRAPEERSFS